MNNPLKNIILSATFNTPNLAVSDYFLERKRLTDNPSRANAIKINQLSKQAQLIFRHIYILFYPNRKLY